MKVWKIVRMKINGKEEPYPEVELNGENVIAEGKLTWIRNFVGSPDDYADALSKKWGEEGRAWGRTAF